MSKPAKANSLKLIAAATLSFGVLAACGGTEPKKEDPKPVDQTEVEDPKPVEPVVKNIAIDLKSPLAWETRNTAIVTEITPPEGVTGPAFRVELEPESAVLDYDNSVAVSAGDIYTASVLMWADTDTDSVRFAISRHCGATDAETRVTVANLTTEPTETELSYTFENDHNCARMQIDSRDTAVTFYMASPNLVATVTE